VGRSRLHPAVEAKLQELLGTHDRPRMAEVYRAVREHCERRSLTTPSRSTLYNAVRRVQPPSFALDALPETVRRTLHNVGSGPIPGHQVAFAAFNYGDTRALCFAAGMPWVCLDVAARLGGWRPKSLALLRAVLAYRERRGA
jgi:hypothetical protein